jgi:hypothetical protein
MAERLTGRHRVLVARSLHPEYREVLATYARNVGLHIEEIGFTRSGEIDAGELGEYQVPPSHDPAGERAVAGRQCQVGAAKLLLEPGCATLSQTASSAFRAPSAPPSL